MSILTSILSGLLGGTFALLGAFATRRHGRSIFDSGLAESRAVWYAEKRLDGLQKYHSTLSKAYWAVQNYKLYLARSRMGGPSPNVAMAKRELPEHQSKFEYALDDVRMASGLSAERLDDHSKRISKYYMDYVMAEDHDGQITKLYELGKEIGVLMVDTENKYKSVVRARLSGDDTVKK